MKRIVVFTGAGISSESGLRTFRDDDGLWEEYDFADFATIEAWQRNREGVLRLFNDRRQQTMAAQPNDAHKALVELESNFRVDIITQNIDDLHERAGSNQVLHLHGEINKARSTTDAKLVYDLQGKELKIGDLCEQGSQLRPHVVLFGEEVPDFEEARGLIRDAELLIIVGTSLNVFPAAHLVREAATKNPKYLVDTEYIPVSDIHNLTFLKEKASLGVPRLVEMLNELYA